MVGSKRYILISIFIFSHALNAQIPEPQCDPDDMFTPFVEVSATRAWAKCDMRCAGQPGPFHIMLVGDSVGALLAASPSPMAWQVNGVKSKSWDYFLTDPAPEGAASWRVLNTAVSATTAHFWRSGVEKCLGDHESEEAARWRATAPGRVWMEIGGNDIKYAHAIAVNPHWAHYVNNRILNQTARMVTLFQQNGRTVLLMGYHSEKAAYVTGGAKLFKDNDLIETLCGTDNEVADILFNDGVCLLADGSWQVITNVTGGFFDGLNKMRMYLDDRLGPAAMLLDGSWLQKIPGGSMVYGALRTIDIGLGNALGLNHSLTGLFEDPARRFFGKNGHKMDSYESRFGDAVPWQVFWAWLQSTPRYEEGWAVQFAGPNKRKAESAVITIYGRRLMESYWAQGVPIPGTNGRTVEYVSAEAAFKDPVVEWASRNELMADDVHPNDNGYRVYGPIVARKLKDLQYDVHGSDYDFTSGNWKDWTPLPEDPVGEDLTLLLLCFYFGICK